MSCLDFWFWGVAMEEVRKSRPFTLTVLKAVVDAFAKSVDPEEVKRPVGPVGQLPVQALRLA